MVIPHMGWNKLEMQHDCPILRNMPEESYVYFVHSYQAVVPDEYLAAYVEYGPAKIPAMVYDGKRFTEPSSIRKKAERSGCKFCGTLEG